MTQNFLPPPNPNRKGRLLKAPGAMPPPPPTGGKITGFPPPLKPRTPSAPPASQAPPTPPAPPTTAPSVEEVEEELGVMLISDEEIEDMKDYRAAVNVQYITTEAAYKLASSRDDVVRQELAMNPATPPAILEFLSKDPNPQVREEVVYNPSTPQEAYAEMVSDQSTWVREALLKNSRTSTAMLREIEIGGDVYLQSLLDQRY